MTLPNYFKAALILLGVSLVMSLVGFSTSYWMNGRRSGTVKYHYGLWSICSKTYCASLGKALSDSLGGHVYVARLFGFCQLLGVTSSIVFILLFTFKSAKDQWAKIAYALSLFSGIIGLIGATIFIGKESSGGVASPNWSGILVILAAIMEIVAGVMLCIPVRRGQVDFVTS